MSHFNSPFKNYYEILDVNVKASQEEIRKAYHSACLKYHPDKNSSTQATEMFKEISKAYEILGDDEKREKYDARFKYETQNNCNPREDGIFTAYQTNQASNLSNILIAGAAAIIGAFTVYKVYKQAKSEKKP